MTYSIHEAAWQLGLKPDSLRRKARRTKIGTRTGAGFWSFSPEDIAKLRDQSSDRRFTTKGPAE